jgi:RNA polymerase sigma factor (TIGR02999 family)
VNQGRPGAFVELVDRVYDDLRGIAAGRMRQQFDRPLRGLTVPPTAIVHDALVRLRQQRAQWQNSRQFFAIAARLLQQLILDYQKQRLSLKRGGGQRGAPLDVAGDADLRRDDAGAKHADVLDIIARLHDEHARAAEVVTLHVLCDYKLDEVASKINARVQDVEADWRFARAWLKAHLR